MQPFPWRPRMRGVTPRHNAFSVVGVNGSALAVLPVEAREWIDIGVTWIEAEDAAPDLDDEATVGAYIGAIKDTINRSGETWDVVFSYYSSTRQRWRIEARREGREHRGEAKCLGEAFTRAGALKAAWSMVSA